MEGGGPRHPIDTTVSNSGLLALLQALRLALPQLGSARTYFEHFDVFIGTVGKMINVYLPLPALLGWHASDKEGKRFQILPMLTLFARVRQRPLRTLVLRSELWYTRAHKWVY